VGAVEVSTGGTNGVAAEATVTEGEPTGSDVVVRAEEVPAVPELLVYPTM